MMDVLITMSGRPYIEGAAILVPFVAIARIANQPPFEVNFRVSYAWGSTPAQRRTAILNAAAQARTDYETSHGVSLPAVNQIEVFGIS